MKAIRSKKAKIVILAEDCSKLTQKKVLDKCTTNQIEVIKVMGQEELSIAVGHSNIAFVAILDEGFAKLIKKNSCS